MSRVARKPIHIPKGSTVQVNGESVVVKSGNNQVVHSIPRNVKVNIEGDVIHIDFEASSKKDAGTLRANISNTVIGLSKGFEIKLVLVGVGYKAAKQGTTLVLNLGHSHPISFEPPKGITIDLPTQTEIVVKGADKQVVGQVAAKIRSFREPEPYKGKGVKYSNEVIILKETKKK